MNKPKLDPISAALADILGGKRNARQVRSQSFALDAGHIDIEKRTVDIAFASDAPIERSWGFEILDHGPSSMRTDRVKRSMPLLMDHDPTDQVGVVEPDSVRVGSDKVARAVVRFGKSARANEVFQDVVDGIRSTVSFGYRIRNAVEEGKRDGYPVVRITDWEPYEITFCSVPADISVGVGRSDETEATLNPALENTVENTEHAAAVASAADAATRAERAAAELRTKDAVRTAEETERKRVADIVAIGEKYGRYNVRAVVTDALRAGKSTGELQADILAAIASDPTRTDDNIGLGSKEKQRYSLCRALAHLSKPDDKKARDAARFEIECSAAAAERSGKQPQGLLVPHDILTRQLPIHQDMAAMLVQRALSVGTATAGGNTVATDLLASDFISLLRNAMVITGLGARMLTGLQGNVEIPRQSGGATAYWVGEGSDTTESDQAFNQVPLTPHTVGTYTDMTRRLLLQSSIDVESLVQTDLATVIALAIQSAAIQGGGSNQPTGILTTSGIGAVAGGTNGLAPTWANVVDLETAVAVANADVGTLAYLTNAKVRGVFKKTQKFASSNGDSIWDTNDSSTPLNGYRVGVTNAVPANGTKGSGTGLSSIIFGNFADLLIGMWGGLDILVDPYTNSKNGTVRVRILQDVDVAVRHPESFSAMTDAIA